MTLVWLAMGLTAQMVAQVDNGAVRVRIVRQGAELVEELSAKDRQGVYRQILVSATHPDAKPNGNGAGSSALRGSSVGLFDAPPSFRFTQAKANGRTLTLTSKLGEWSVTKTIEVPAGGVDIVETVDAKTTSAYPQIRYLLNSYAFAPGKPDETWTPGLRPNDGDVIGDHWFRAPAAVLRKGSLAATVMPDLDVLSENRPIPTILDLDVANGVTKAPLVSYGFCDHRLSAHVRYTSDDSMTRPVPWQLKLRSQIRLDADATPGSPVSDAATYMWNRYGHRYFGKVLPQVMSFADYAELCYPAAFNEKMTGGWFERNIDGHICGGLPSGWGLDKGWVSWQCWFNQVRSAWGLRWWGKKLNHPDWVAKSEKMLNLALAAPVKQGACPTTYMSRTNEWKGALISPTADCYYDIPSIAWKSIWLLRWYSLPDCPRKTDIAKQLSDTYALMRRIQRADGSFPSWLTKNLKVASPLDRSAQSALPVWFIEEYADSPLGRDAKADDAIHRGVAFLEGAPVSNRLYYDFETFFSCSPKTCLQQNELIDDARMWDPHTMQPPQNTLSMQWCAEALFRASSLRWGRAERFAPGTAPSKAMMALDTMNMYQNVWPISYRPVAYTYGGFGVQNSDGEYDDARQAQFGSTLCDFGAKLGRQDLFERGVAAIRASLTLVNVPNDPYQVYPNPNYPVGLEPENCGHGGANEQDGRSGFDWAEGSGLASAAEVMDKYGSTYQGKNWTVKIDATPAPYVPPTPLTDPAFEFTQPKLAGWQVDGNFLNWPTRSNRYDFNANGKPFIGTCEDGRGWFDDTYTGTLVSPTFVTTKSSIHLLVGGGSGDTVGVELIDEKGQRLAVARGNDDERMHEVTWSTAALKGKKLRIRIFDNAKGPWGHINVGNIQCR